MSAHPASAPKRSTPRFMTLADLPPVDNLTSLTQRVSASATIEHRPSGQRSGPGPNIHTLRDLPSSAEVSLRDIEPLIGKVEEATEMLRQRGVALEHSIETGRAALQNSYRSEYSDADAQRILEESRATRETAQKPILSILFAPIYSLFLFLKNAIISAFRCVFVRS